MNFVKDYPKAEQNYKKALAINPRGAGYYVSLYYLYRDMMHDNASAADILAQGLKELPTDPTLLSLKAGAN